MKPIDLWELKKQIEDGDFRTFVNNERVYNEHFPQFASDHEAWAVVREEFEETRSELEAIEEGLFLIWEQVKRNYNTNRNYEMVENNAVQLIQEAIQLAAMCRKARAV